METGNTNAVHTLGNGWTAQRVGKLFHVYRDGVFQFASCRLKSAVTQIKSIQAKS